MSEISDREQLAAVYVAGTWDDRWVVQRVCRELHAYGIEQTRPWWTYADTGDGALRQAALDDVAGVREADIFALYRPQHLSLGKFVEMGVAVALRKPVYCIGGKMPRHPFAAFVVAEMGEGSTVAMARWLAGQVGAK